MAWGNKQQEGLSFPQIVLRHLNKILELSTHELRVSERILIVDNVKSVIESEDLRRSYCQAIQNLSYVLTPYFDEDMKKENVKHMPILEGFGYEIIKKMEDKEFKKRFDESDKTEKSNLIIMFQIRHAQKLFVELNKLLTRVSYLAKAVFGEDKGDDDDVIEDEEDN